MQAMLLHFGNHLVKTSTAFILDIATQQVSLSTFFDDYLLMSQTLTDFISLLNSLKLLSGSYITTKACPILKRTFHFPQIYASCLDNTGLHFSFIGFVEELSLI
ncbi:hypothetical protein BofuT4_P077060.1 [Botrytis cinerea T4]|uniref:Reverse transcriptase domain-containing protein n=1 Tax=Botryotinia fuckeliana (strain T4) TaxID=999810 RepID=G2YLB5_BOTF4|nr:hypothetical protein BofuT4_P077060.1 [Botrytis cinerea T4]